jgi:DNA-binding MarR family transcriptional regulator
MEPLVKNSTIFPFERAFKVIAHRADAWLRKRLDCTRRELWVLLCVDDVQLTQTQLVDILHLHPNVVSNLVKSMEKKKLLRRTRRPTDQREQMVGADEKGHTLVKTYLKERPEAVKDVFAPLDEREREQLRQLCLRVFYGRQEKEE